MAAACITAAARLTGCSVSGSTAGGDGGGMFSYGPLTLTNCTVSDNEAVEGGGMYCGNYYTR